MRVKLQPGQRLGIRTKLLILFSASSGVFLLVFLLFSGYFQTGIQTEVKAYETETIPTGSFIINMGIAPQTYANGLKPYGMIYELTTTYNVPVKWIIEPSKAKDGNDFSHNSVNYRGGAFIIPAPYITSTINDRITYWQSEGVQGNFSVSSLNLPVYATITSFPLVIIDSLSLNDTIIEKYYENAGIPSSAYVKGSPDQVNSCHDMWVNPHGDPTWDTHNYLYDFVTVEKSFIWMQCHAVSMMESCRMTVAPFTQLNYLTTTGLQCYMNNQCQSNTEYHARNVPGSIAYFHPSDPVMQYIGGISNVISEGSERWFIPKTAGGWRTTTKRLVTVGTTTSPREGVGMVYGPAYGDSTNGYVMYMGGHDMNAGSTADRIAAQRSFFNFLLLAGGSKAPAMSEELPASINANATDTFTVSIAGGIEPYTITWSSSLGGTFSDPNDSITAYSAPHTEIPLETIITCVVTDVCGRRAFISNPLIINASPLPISLISFTAKPFLNSQVQLNWTTGSERNNDYFTIERSKDGKNFNSLLTVSSQGNSNSVSYYNAIDNDPPAGIVYYRLSQTDIDGTTTKLKVVKTETTKSRTVSKINTGPNPFNDKLKIYTDGTLQGHTTIRIFNISGKLVHEKSLVLHEGETEIIVEGLDNLPSGNYIISYQNGETTYDGIKVVKN